MLKRVCSTCHSKKDLDDFPVDPRYRGGHKGQCKTCKSTYGTLWSRNRALERKPLCAVASCERRVALHRTLYCSKEHADIVRNQQRASDWKRRYKNNEEFRQRHRIVARESARRKRALYKQEQQDV